MSANDPCPAACTRGRIPITEAEHTDMITAVEGTWTPISTVFGPGGAAVECPWCTRPGADDRAARIITLRTLIHVRDRDEVTS